MAKRSSLRASDADRDRVAERLRQAASEGRLLAHEFEERLHQTLRARTYGDLDDVVSDLPGAPRGTLERKRPSGLQLAGKHPFMAAVVVVLSTLMVLSVVAVMFMIAVISSVAFLVLGGGRRHRGARRPHPMRYSRFEEAQQVLTNARRYGRF